ncbi:MAG: hypothetical protein R3E52_01820 [Burkholderiaceae bacterium]
MPVTPARAGLELFAARLRIQGFARWCSTPAWRWWLPEAEAKLQAGSVSAAPSRAAGRSRRRFSADARERQQPGAGAAPADRPNNTINVNPGTNALVITDYGDNLQRIARIIAARWTWRTPPAWRGGAAQARREKAGLRPGAAGTGAPAGERRQRCAARQRHTRPARCRRAPATGGNESGGYATTTVLPSRAATPSSCAPPTRRGWRWRAR